MNYLAHAYLSFGDVEILAGNIFSDFIKGKRKFDFPHRIQLGIDLHRSIDQFTDDHSATKKAKQYFKPVYGLYAAAFVDVVYDHFLAKDKNIFTANELAVFASTTYSQLQESEALFPERFRLLFHYMELQNWLYNYQFEEGIFRSFGGLVRRAKYMDDPQPACEILVRYYDELSGCYEAFFPELRAFALRRFGSFQ
jgi:acyl carrier protein phosphodiesterase